MNLLIVNDERVIADTMAQSMEWEVYRIDRVFVAYNAEEAKDIISGENIDIILCDIEMPGEDGLALCRWIRDMELELECVFLTCHANFAYAREAIALKAEDYILMPAPYEEIGRTILRTIEKIEDKKRNSSYRLYYEHMLQESAQAAADRGERSSPEQFVGQAIQLILEHLGDEDLTVNSVAEQLHLHPVYLSRIFTREQHISIKQFIIRERMNRASDLLLRENLSIAAVAEQVGYRNNVNFYTIFKKFYGCTPLQYVKNKGGD